MDLGLRGKTAIICASSRGLGRACAEALVKEGCNVVLNGLDEARLAATAEAIEKLGGTRVIPVSADINTEEGREKLVAACPVADILVNNNAGPPPGKFEDWRRQDWLSAIEANMLAPILLIQALVPGMRARRFGRVVNITSAMVKSPKFADMGLSSAARTGLVALSKSLSRTVMVDNVTINTLMPERIDTDRQRFMAERMMKQHDISLEEARRQIAESLPAKRMGTTEEFGSACAYLCSVQASFITGQSLQLDGGSYEGLF